MELMRGEGSPRMVLLLRRGVEVMLGRRGEACCSRTLLTGRDVSELTILQPAMPD